jgi:5-methylcytosine-specific restriction endonuclease McrA
MSVLADHVLMLNKNWLPVGTCTVRSAFSRIFDGKARFLTPEDFQLHELESWLRMSPEQGERKIRTAKACLKVPEVLVLNSTIVPRRRLMQFSRRNLSKRDNYTCQYCGVRPGPQLLTVDHVIPKKRGGKSTWQNCVLSCVECNHKKADRTPEEAGMRLLPRPEKQASCPNDGRAWCKPYAPAWSPIFRVPNGKVLGSWHGFLSGKNAEPAN